MIFLIKMFKAIKLLKKSNIKLTRYWNKVDGEMLTLLIRNPLMMSISEDGSVEVTVECKN